MDTQMNLFTGVVNPPETGSSLRDKGIAKAIDSAEQEVKGWSDGAFEFLIKFMRTRAYFMVEEVREASDGIIPEPPSTRAWGGVIVRASRRGYVSREGYRAVKNANAHCTPATLWRVNHHKLPIEDSGIEKEFE